MLTTVRSFSATLRRTSDVPVVMVTARNDTHDVVAGLEAGADDVKQENDQFEVLCEVDAYTDVAAALESAEIEPSIQQITRIPENTIELDVAVARKVLKLMTNLDDHDDVQSVSSNFSVSPEAMAQLSAE